MAGICLCGWIEQGLEVLANLYSGLPVGYTEDIIPSAGHKSWDLRGFLSSRRKREWILRGNPCIRTWQRRRTEVEGS